MEISRRQVLQSLGLGMISLNLPVWGQQVLGFSLPRAMDLPLEGPDKNGFFLPRGFTSRIIAKTGERVCSKSDYDWHYAPDGGATLPTDDGGWIYVSNSESFFSFSNFHGGGAGALRFDSSGEIVDAYSLLSRTIANCAGGLTPWGSWLSCEEFDLFGIANAEMYLPFGRTYKGGLVWETFPLEPEREAVAHPSMGVFKHEAAAFDEQGYVYLTEDQPDGCFYRFIPERHGDLSRGILQAAAVRGDGSVSWLDLPAATTKNLTATKNQGDGASRFDGGEGAAYYEGKIYFTTKGDNKVWVYDVNEQFLDVLYDAANESGKPQLTGVDNIAVTPSGQIAVAEDGGNMELVGVNQRGEAVPLLRLEGHPGSELTGPAFSPDGGRLYISSQRGTRGRSSDGVTYEIKGPFPDLKI